MPAPALYSGRKIFSTAFTPNNPIVVDLTRLGVTTDYINEITVEIVGQLSTGTAGAGTPTGRTNPEDLLVSAILQTNPTVATCVPFNQVSGRSFLIDEALNDRCFRKANFIIDNSASVQNVNIKYRLICKRKAVKGAIEYGIDSSRYQGLTLTLNFGDQTRLYTGSSNAWPLSGLTVNVWIHSAFNVNPRQIHAWELFEQNYPILQTTPDFLIQNLSSGFLYTDLCYLTEVNNALAGGVLNNIDIEGGGRVWLQQGQTNADWLQRVWGLQNFDGSVMSADDPDLNTNSPVITGIYPITIRNNSGMYSRQIDALTAQFISKLDVTFPNAVTNVRLFGRRMVQGAVYQAPAPTKGK